MAQALGTSFARCSRLGWKRGEGQVLRPGCRPSLSTEHHDLLLESLGQPGSVAGPTLGSDSPNPVGPPASEPPKSPPSVLFCWR